MPDRPARLRRKLTVILLVAALGALVTLAVPRLDAQGTSWKVVAWNNLGMHCMDADFGVFAILPPTTRFRRRSSTRPASWRRRRAASA